LTKTKGRYGQIIYRRRLSLNAAKTIECHGGFSDSRRLCKTFYAIS